MILITGGAGFIGSKVAKDLLERGEECIILDNLSNNSDFLISQLKSNCYSDFVFLKGDILDQSFLLDLFSSYEITSVFHFAGLKSVSQSILHPIDYYNNNFCGTLSLLNTMSSYGCKKIVFSSSATVYGVPKQNPLFESHSVDEQLNPYGRSKRMCEQLIEDWCKVGGENSAAILRYFNPIGADPDLIIGEVSNERSENLMPHLLATYDRAKSFLQVFGDDYDTHDGTGVRDYIHIQDLSSGHIAAHNFLSENYGFHIWNLGSGCGYSVLDIVSEFEIVSNIKIPYRLVERRLGDVAECWSSIEKADQELGWKPAYKLRDMLRHHLSWHKKISEL